MIFEAEPFDHARKTAEELCQNRQPKEIARIMNEIELELEQPSQQLRDILESVASEDKCRQFLAAVLTWMRTAETAG